MSPFPSVADDFPISQMHLNALGSIQQQENEGFLGGKDTKRWPYALPLNWEADPFKHRNWRFRLSSWRIIDVYITHQTLTSLTKAADLVLD